MDVSKNRGVSPQIIHFNSVFHYKLPLFLVQHPYGAVCGLFFSPKFLALRFLRSILEGFLVWVPTTIRA